MEKFSIDAALLWQPMSAEERETLNELYSEETVDDGRFDPIRTSEYLIIILLVQLQV